MVNLPAATTVWTRPDVRSIVGADESCVYVRQEGDLCVALDAETGAPVAELGELLGSTSRYWITGDNSGAVLLISRGEPKVVNLAIPAGRMLQSASVVGEHVVITSWDGQSLDYPSGAGFGLEIFALDGRHVRHVSLAEPTFSLLPLGRQHVACDHEIIDVASGQRIATCEDPGGLSRARFHQGRLELWGEESVVWADPTSGRTVGGFRLPFNTWEAPVFGADHAFLAHDEALTALDKDGQTVWTTPTSEDVEVLEFGGGCIWMLDSHGLLTGLNAETGQRMHAIHLIGDIVGSEVGLAALSRGTLVSLRSSAA